MHMPDVAPLENGGVEFPPIRPKNLIRLGADLLHAFSSPFGSWISSPEEEEREYLLPISDLISRDSTSPTGLSTAEVAQLEDTFRKATSTLASQPLHYPILDLRLRLYAYALLCESRIFPGVELYDKSEGCWRLGFTDIWKGEYRGQIVRVKVMRTQSKIPLIEIIKAYRRVNEGGGSGPHPNVLPVIEVSKTLFPLCIMTPWMPNGNIVDYITENWGADRLLLLAQACRGLMYLHGLGIIHGDITPSNIFITQDGQACLGEFGIIGAFRRLNISTYDTESLEYMAPECSVWGEPSKESDVYSLALTSFSVLADVSSRGDRFQRVARAIRVGVQPPRPKWAFDGWLADPIWGAITAGWRREPEWRCELPVMYRVFLTPRPPVVQNVITDVETGPQRQEKLLPRIVSFFQSLRDSETQRRVNEVDKRLEGHALSDRERLELFNELCKTCSRNRVIPKSMHIPDCSEGSVEVECGGFANILQSTYEGRRVAVKVVRMYLTSDLDVILSRFCREGVAWKHLRHPNILPLLGVTVSKYQFALVSEWMENGNINEFIRKHQHINRAELLVDVANGLKYMHNLRIVHGDLKGANILINGAQRACIADFGLSTITGVGIHTTDETSRTSVISDDTLMSFTGGGTRRWMSPELLDPEMFGMPESEDNRPTRQSDCYALGMVIYEILCGHHPYLEIPSDILAVNAIMEGVRPRKPEDAKRLGFSDELWRIVELCWLEDRNARPSVEEIISCLNDATGFWYLRDL